MKVQSVNTTRTYVIEMSETELAQYPSLKRKVTGVKKIPAKVRAAKRSTPSVPKTTKFRTLKCPVDGKTIKLRGAKQHVPAHARKSGWGEADIVAMMKKTFPES